jgi:hypothetical protein
MFLIVEKAPCCTFKFGSKGSGLKKVVGNMAKVMM